MGRHLYLSLLRVCAIWSERHTGRTKVTGRNKTAPCPSPDTERSQSGPVVITRLRGAGQSGSPPSISLSLRPERPDQLRKLSEISAVIGGHSARGLKIRSVRRLGFVTFGTAVWTLPPSFLAAATRIIIIIRIN